MIEHLVNEHVEKVDIWNWGNLIRVEVFNYCVFQKKERIVFKKYTDADSLF